MKTLVAVLAALVGACTRPAPTWSDDVAPLVGRRCLPCHATGRSAPFLDEHAAAARAAGAIVRAVERREMPPWGPDETGACGTFVDARWLAADEIATFAAWARAGAPAGPDARVRAHDAAPARAAPIGRRVVVDPAAAFAPDVGAAATRCFLVPPVVERDAAVVGVVGAGDVPLQQQLFALDDDAAATAARSADDDDDAPGWLCPRGGPAGGRLVASWSYSTPVQRLAVGVPLRGGAPLVLQARADLTAVGRTASLRPRLELVVDDHAAPGAVWSVRAPADAAAIGGKRVVVAATHAVAAPARIVGVVPRMGSTGRVLDVVVTGGDRRVCVAHFGHWRPTQAQLFRRVEPVAVAVGDVVRVSCGFDAADRAARVQVGDVDEIACAADLLVSAARPSSSSR